jgi:sulfite exporter TauE/SafE
MFIIAAITLGFLGSFHCIGMCGPIALTIPVNRNTKFNIFAGSLIYNLGRITTYSIIGVLFGFLGKGFVLAGWQNSLSIALGISILIILIIPNISKKYFPTSLLMRFLEKLKSKIRILFGIKTLTSLYTIGILNGLLPCGLVYMAIAGSIATGDEIKGALFMSGFGAGTLPTMMLITFVRDYITIGFRENIRKVIPVFVGVMAILLILRGLNLGIPYISPSIKTDSGISHHQCCHK